MGGGANPLLGRLRRASPTAVLLVTVAVILISLLFLGPFGAIVLLLLAATMLVMLALTWSRHDRRSRIIRLLILGVLVALALTRLATR